MSRGFREVPHLVKRFVQTLWPGTPSVSDEAWAAGWLSPTEEALWRSQPPVDRRHTIAVARSVASTFDGASPPPWLMAAALLHDVGKAHASLGVTGRTVATILELLDVRRVPGRLGAYLSYTERGAAALADAGADPRVVAWTREHHLPAPKRSGIVPTTDAELLARADRS
ncbi:MAG: hypothetical protein QOJ19_3993 [Acidimicrobiia bacterium]|nr:hypothetical protein [Acidimicrobiia bacterium]